MKQMNNFKTCLAHLGGLMWYWECLT